MSQKKAILVKPLSKQRIEPVLHNAHLGHLLTRDHDGDPIIVVPSDKGDGDLECCFSVAAEIFHLVCSLGPKIPQCQWATATAVCNAYHRYSLLGRAVLHGWHGDDVGTLRLEAAFECSDGVSDGFLQTFIVTHIASACFLRDLALSQKVWSASATTGEDAVIARPPSEPMDTSGSAGYIRSFFKKE
jgi:hypothetical protein